MRKIICAFIITLFAASLTAQTTFQLGLHFSPSVNWIKPDIQEVEHGGTKIGFSGGLVGDFNISENYSFSTGISIVNTGGRLTNSFTISDTSKSTITDYTNERDFTLKYLEIPLKLKLKTNQIGYLTYFGQFGFGLGFNYDAAADIETSPDEPEGSAKLDGVDVDYKDEINLMRLALIVGLGAEYNLSGSTSLIIGVTFNNGFTNIFNKKAFKKAEVGFKESGGTYDKVHSDEAKAINNFVTLDLGVLF